MRNYNLIAECYTIIWKKYITNCRNEFAGFFFFSFKQKKPMRNERNEIKLYNQSSSRVCGQ